MASLILGPLYQCRTHFNVLKYESDIDFATDTTPSWTDEAYTPVITVPADHTYVNSNSNILANNYSFPLSKSRKGKNKLASRGPFILGVDPSYLPDSW